MRGRCHFLIALLCALGCGASNIEPPRAPSSAPTPVTPVASSAAPVSPQTFADAASEPAFLDKTRRTKLESAFGALDALIDEDMRAQQMTSVTVGVIIDGELAYAKGFGYADVAKKTVPDADTVYRIGSISKSFTALAILSLRDEGALSLEDPLTRWLPEAAGLVYPTKDTRPITLRQLLTHASGLPSGGRFSIAGATEDEILRSLSGTALERAPDARFEYSNLGYVLLGLTVGRASHTSLRDVVKKRILAPLGMTSTAYEIEDVPAAKVATPYERLPNGEVRPAPQWRVDATAGAGALFSSVRDMARYVALQLSAYPARSAPDDGPVKRATLREAHASRARSGMQIHLEPAPKKGESLVRAAIDTYGFGWGQEASCDLDDMVRHNGGMPGYTADVLFLPERGVGVVVLDNANADPTALADKIVRALARTGGLSKRSLPAPAALEGAMKKFLGVYNAWDEAAYHAMLTAGRPPQPVEKEELAGYKALHGTCTGYSVIEVESSASMKLALQCERGPMELRMLLGADGLVAGFVGITHGVPVPKETRKVADRVAALIAKWDDATFKKHLTKTRRTRDELAATFERLRTAHGSCAVTSATFEGTDRRLDLDCARGEALSLVLETDPKDPDTIVELGFRGASEGACPVR